MPLSPSQLANPQAQMMQMMMAMLAGSGFKNMTKGISDLAQSGMDLQSMMTMPAMPMMMAGAGLKDAANSMDIVGPIMKMMQPPQPPPPPDPREVNAAMQMLSARMGPGLTGVVPPPAPMMNRPMIMGGGQQTPNAGQPSGY